MAPLAMAVMHSLVWWAPFSLVVLVLMPAPYICWLAEHHLFSPWGDWVSAQPWCLMPPAVTEVQLLLPLWGVALVPLAALVTGWWSSCGRSWPLSVRVALSVVGVWLYWPVPLYFFWLAAKS